MSKDIEQYYDKILRVYKDLGYPWDLIGQWTLPLKDAQTLLAIIQKCRPQNVLEVGTFVGMTTLLLALFTSPETHIHSVDPNFPLRVEMESMRSNLYDFDTSIKAQELAFQAAERLGVGHKITFHAGGFSTGNTFASYNLSPASRIHIVGPEICKSFGPFDFIFIDGLHYEEDVFADLNLAVEHLVPSGSIALHDVIGPWGSNVRRAVLRFLEGHPDFLFSHGKYADIYDAIGLLRHYPGNQKPVPETDNSDLRTRGLIQEIMLPNLAAILIHMFSPASVIQIGGNIELLEDLKNYGVPEVCALTFSGQDIQHDTIPIKQFNPEEKYPLEKGYDLCLCLDGLDSLPEDYIDKIIQTCVTASNTVIFACTPPGEMGYSHHYDRPLTYWMHKFYTKGYIFWDTIRPVLEPINFSDIINPEYQYNSSYLMNLYLVKKDDKLSNDRISKSYLEEIIIREETRIEDLHLQNLYQKNITNHYRGVADLYKNEYEKTLATINLFNKRVINNTWKRIKEKIRQLLQKNIE